MVGQTSQMKRQKVRDKIGANYARNTGGREDQRENGCVEVGHTEVEGGGEGDLIG